MSFAFIRPVFFAWTVASLVLGRASITSLQGQTETSAAPSTFVDEHGVMRWTQSHEEVAQFGVNYTAPFAHAFRVFQRLNIPWEKAIDADVYHFARLGFDAYRVHIWDREISDPEGNLVVNDHVRALDYLLAKLKERGIKIILTPLQFSDAAYPEGGVPLNGFSSKYGKEGCLDDRESWPLQVRYLTQFMDHVNPHTGLAYKNDPDLIGIEICNEPGHSDYALALDYINTMTRAVRATGYRSPVFYNMSHGLPVHQAYLDAEVQGGTFQWYPAGLVANHEQWGNFLPYLENYSIPFANETGFQNKAKIVYEFDSADIGRSYQYPAFARTFRKAGFQFATQFAYDPMYIAAVNTEYQTHYLNLAYAPQKALSMKIASEAFHRIPLGHDYGAYPADTHFSGIHLSYPEDLAELVTDEKYFYTNHTLTPPPVPEKLTQIAGYGSSPIVDYPGQGAYFLDRLEPGVWRLEVMPDAIWVHDPFERASPKKQVTRIAWNRWPMRIILPDLGPDFQVLGLNDGNAFRGKADRASIPITPGTYLLTRRGAPSKWKPEDKWGHLTLNEFVAPAASLDRTYVLHHPAVEASANETLPIEATIASAEPVEKVELIAYSPQPPSASNRRAAINPKAQPGKGHTPGVEPPDLGGSRSYPMTQVAGLHYRAELPADQLIPGVLHYHIVVVHPHSSTTYPSGFTGRPTDWDFYGEGWLTRIVKPSAPVLLFDAAVDADKITGDHREAHYDLVPSELPGTTALVCMTRDLDEPEHDFSFRFFFRNKVKARHQAIASKQKLVVYGKSTTNAPCPLQLALVTSEGYTYGGNIVVEPENGSLSLSLGSLKSVRAPNIPHGYPVFLPFWSTVTTDAPLDLSKVESVLVSIGPGLAPSDYQAPHGVQIERIWLE